MKNEDLIKLTNGNGLALQFVVSYVKFCHLLDDVVDLDQEVTDKRVANETLGFIEQLIMNPWVKDHIVYLWPLIVVGANSWVDSNRLAKSKDKNDRIASDVLKGQYHEVVWFTARLCGGQEFMNEITTQFRAYDFEKQKE